MDEAARIKMKIKGLIREYFSGIKSNAEFIPGKTRIPLIIPSYGWQEVAEAVDSMLTTRVTMGDKVKQFESMFANYIGVNHTIMVNSGSSANLLALSILANPLTPNGLRPGDEVITPAVTWATTVYPIIQMGAVPVLVDVDLDTFNISVAEIGKAITDRTRAIMLVHLCGNPCDMAPIMDIARRHNLFVIEDTCEGRMGIMYGLDAMLGFDIGRYVLHGARTVKGYHGSDVAECSRFKLFNVAAHTGSFQLKNAGSLS